MRTISRPLTPKEELRMHRENAARDRLNQTHGNIAYNLGEFFAAHGVPRTCQQEKHAHNEGPHGDRPCEEKPHLLMAHSMMRFISQMIDADREYRRQMEEAKR